MRNTDSGPLDPGLAWRLKFALDRITPPATFPRYAGQPVPGLQRWRVAPMLVAAAAACMLVLTATFTTGSANPVVWTQRAATTIQSVQHAAAAAPNPQSTVPVLASPHTSARPTQQAGRVKVPSPRPSALPAASPRPEHSDRWGSWGGHSWPSPTGSPYPSRPSPSWSPWPSHRHGDY